MKHNIYPSTYEEWLEPPEYEDPVVDEYIDEIEIELNDQHVVVTDNGYFNFENPNEDPTWVAEALHDTEWKENSLPLDSSDIISNVLDAIEVVVPYQPGVYSLTGLVTLSYKVNVRYYADDEDDKDVTCDLDSSDVSKVTCFFASKLPE